MREVVGSSPTATTSLKHFPPFVWKLMRDKSLYDSHCDDVGRRVARAGVKRARVSIFSKASIGT